MHRNLSGPLQELRQLAEEEGRPIPPLKVGLRTGDSTSAERARLIKRPPHLLVTTPESLYLLLTSDKGRERLRTVQTVIVDEIHALMRDKRGSHLALSLERLEHLCGRRLQRIGLSATQKPLELVAKFLVGGSDEIGRPDQRTPPHPNPLPRGGGEGTKPEDSDFSSHPPSAIQYPPSAIRHPLSPTCTVINVGHARQLDLDVEVPTDELSAVCSHEQWALIHARLVELIESHRSTVIFVNTRRLAERLTHSLSELLGPDRISSHHGSLSADLRHKTEQRLKSGQLRAVVATASLELGLDVGYIDLVVQIGSPRSIATFLQRIGRSGHCLHAIPKGRIVPLTRDELLECLALLRAVKARRLDAIHPPEKPLDVLAQQIVAEASCQEWDVDELFALCRRAWPFRNLPRDEFEEALRFLSEGFVSNSGRGKVYLHYDRVNKRIRSRPMARPAAISNAGAIPEIASYRVVADPEQTVVGSVDEDFALESMRGDVFLLGNTSWRVQSVRGTDVTVVDAHGAPPTIPFWLGEGPGRTRELSEEVSRLRFELEQRVDDVPGAIRWLIEETSFQTPEFRSGDGPALVLSPLPRGGEGQGEGDDEPSTFLLEETLVSDQRANDRGQAYGSARPLSLTLSPEAGARGQDVNDSDLDKPGCRSIVDYVATEKATLGVVPRQDKIVFERFFDETGGMQLVVHAPFGAGITRAWGYAMRKRFCRSFDFELQATADDDGFILSIGPQHSFPIESLFGMLTATNVRGLLEQAVLVQPVFQVRWRWNVTRALLVLRQKFGKKVPPALQRFRADDLLTAVFPNLTGCQENHTGDIEIPDHPLVRQTMHDCLHEAMDIDGLIDVLRRIERGEIQLIARDTREPSPFCYELLNSNPYTFLDGGEVQERRARALATPMTFCIDGMRDLSWLDPAAIAQVVEEVAPLVRSADELHDLLLSVVLLPVRDASQKRSAATGGGSDLLLIEFTDAEWFAELEQQLRAVSWPMADGRQAWSAVERWPAISALNPDLELPPGFAVPEGVPTEWESTTARMAAIRGWMEIRGPMTACRLAEFLGFTSDQTVAALEALEGEGTVLRGHFTSPQPAHRLSSSGGREAPGATLHIGEPNQGADAPRSERADTTEWCHRRLLARIHRLTLAGLRKQIEPVDVSVYQQFLFDHHGLIGESPRTGPNGLFEVISLLQGLDLPAIVWERDILPARLDDYEPGWLDELCLSGEAGWGRLYPPKVDADRSRPTSNLTRNVPVSVFLRADLPWLTSQSASPVVDSPGSLAEELREILSQQGALFAADLWQQTRMLPDHFQEALGELISRGLVTADGFGGLRALIAEKMEKANPRNDRPPRGFTRKRSLTAGAGRWSLWRRPWQTTASGPLAPASGERVRERGRAQDNPLIRPSATFSPKAGEKEQDGVEAWAWQLLRRWGIVFRDLLERETGTPRWWELLQVYRRLEARGELRGGRFITGVAGEQFALESTVRRLREVRDLSDASQKRSVATCDGSDDLIAISAADPLNLTGILDVYPRVPSLATNRVVYRHGAAVAAMIGGEIVWLENLAEQERPAVIRILTEQSAAAVDAGRRRRGQSRRPSRRTDSPKKIPRPLIR